MSSRYSTTCAPLHAYRRVEVPSGFGWARGVDVDYLANLIAYWADSYDWREHETRLRGLLWVLTGENDSQFEQSTCERRKRTPFRCCSFTVGPTRSCGYYEHLSIPESAA